MSDRAEFERVIKLDRIPIKAVEITADEAERSALARRFALPAIHELSAEITLTQQNDTVLARGTLWAKFAQSCAVAREPFETGLKEPVAIRFVPAGAPPPEDEELEFDSDGPDEIEYEGQSFDLGEALAQSFGLALDPYATGPDAEAVRKEAGIADEDAPSGPFAALAGLKTGRS
ncbi:DUF177 domain-containing protein [Qipengyuania sp.]|uniref:YceD family protein n=1 Tax=Qipengyuania sp. TaxID=2004515 RepID=UPI0035C7CE7F